MEFAKLIDQNLQIFEPWNVYSWVYEEKPNTTIAPFAIVRYVDFFDAPFPFVGLWHHIEYSGTIYTVRESDVILRATVLKEPHKAKKPLSEQAGDFGSAAYDVLVEAKKDASEWAGQKLEKAGSVGKKVFSFGALGSGAVLVIGLFIFYFLKIKK